MILKEGWARAFEAPNRWADLPVEPIRDERLQKIYAQLVKYSAIANLLMAAGEEVPRSLHEALGVAQHARLINKASLHSPRPQQGSEAKHSLTDQHT